MGNVPRFKHALVYVRSEYPRFEAASEHEHEHEHEGYGQNWLGFRWQTGYTARLNACGEPGHTSFVVQGELIYTGLAYRLGQ
jgi:hypothetical protein